MNLLKIFAALALAAFLASCAGEETKEQQRESSYRNSISNPENDTRVSDFNVRHFDADQTRSIWEVLTGKPFGHGRLFLYTDPKNRSGWYFFIMFETYEMNIQKGSTVKLQLHISQKEGVRSFAFKIPEDSSLLRELALGITGKDAGAVNDKILAWKIEIFAPDGKPITQKQSWLWDMKSVQDKK